MRLDKLKWLETHTGADFDKQFVEAMTRELSETIMLFGNESRNTQDPALKTFAQETLATIRGNNNMGYRLRAKLF
jgi:predicted outer membrane protein